ncbi:MAG: hypothetical protein LUD46_04310 [Parabacteroides sp.]|nr:hypothetical protein [Parabacteroides sp.]
MKRLTFILLFCIAYLLEGHAQQAPVDSSQFLLHHFENGQVFYKDGRVFNDVQLNYSLLIKKFLFLDKSDNNVIKEFSEPELLASLKIGDRTFLPTKNGATEVLQIDPPIFVQYRGAIKWEGKNVGYGGKSETSAVESYSSLQTSTNIHKLQTEKMILYNIDKTFRIERNGKQYHFFNEKQFLKIYPDHQDVLKKYIKENDINFKSIEDVVKLYNYAVSIDN